MRLEFFKVFVNHSEVDFADKVNHRRRKHFGDPFLEEGEDSISFGREGTRHQASVSFLLQVGALAEDFTARMGHDTSVLGSKLFS